MKEKSKRVLVHWVNRMSGKMAKKSGKNGVGGNFLVAGKSLVKERLLFYKIPTMRGQNGCKWRRRLWGSDAEKSMENVDSTHVVVAMETYESGSTDLISEDLVLPISGSPKVSEDTQVQGRMVQGILFLIPETDEVLDLVANDTIENGYAFDDMVNELLIEQGQVTNSSIQVLLYQSLVDCGFEKRLGGQRRGRDNSI